MGKLDDLSGKRFGQLKVIRRHGTDSNKKPSWECICDCGQIVVRISPNLKNGDTKSCGCLRREITSKLSRTHGMSGTRFYDIWVSMLRRCADDNQVNFKHYGGRGIKVCSNWKVFTNFKDDMYDEYTRHSSEHGENNTTIDRINNNGNYEPGNCRWATYSVQNRNARLRIDNKTGVRGVFYDERSGKYSVSIKSDGVLTYVGTFGDLGTATMERRNAEESLWG